MLFGVQVEDCKETELFFNKARVKLSDASILKSPYSEKRIVNPVKGVYVFFLEPIYPNLSLYGLIAAVVPLLFGAPVWVALFGLLFFAAGVAHTNAFTFLWLYAGLRRKADYKGKIIYLTNQEILKRALRVGWDFGAD